MIEVLITKTGEKKLLDSVSIYPDGRVQFTVNGTDEFAEPETAMMIMDPNREETACVSVLSLSED